VVAPDDRVGAGRHVYTTHDVDNPLWLDVVNLDRPDTGPWVVQDDKATTTSKRSHVQPGRAYDGRSSCQLSPSCGPDPVRDGSHGPRESPAPALFDDREASAQVRNFRRELLSILTALAEQGAEMSGLGTQCIRFGVELLDAVHERERLSRMPRRYLLEEVCRDRYVTLAHQHRAMPSGWSGCKSVWRQ
jgi:hypothetical protein